MTNDEVIHYGVLGMKWGKRKDKGTSAVTTTPKVDNRSDDAKAAQSAYQKSRQSGISSLSNKELQSLNERMNLEANYKRLTTQGTPEKSAVDKGMAVFNAIKKTVDIANDVHRSYNSPAVKLIREQLKNR